MDVAGTALGAASLAITLLDAAVKGYVFFLSVGDYPESCLEARTKFEIEQRRLLDFAEASEIIDLTADDPKKLPRFLQKEYLVLIGVFKQIEAKLDSFAEFTTRYSRLQQDADSTSNLDDGDDHIDLSNINAKERYPALLRWDRATRKRTEKRGLNHLVKYCRIGKDIVTHPKRLRWTAFDQESFLAKVRDLTGYNNFLHELLEGNYLKKLQENTRRTQLEMALVRQGVQEIQALLRAAVPTPSSNSNGASIDLHIIARTRKRVVITDIPESIHAFGEGAPTAEKLEFAKIHPTTAYPTLHEINAGRPRTLVTLSNPNASDSDLTAFIEWKTYLPDDKPDAGILAPNSQNLQRVKGLVNQLQSADVEWSGIPPCLGFFDIRDGPDGVKLPCLFGIVYQMHGTHLSKETRPKLPQSLASLLGQDLPSLSQRVKLAYNLSRSVLYFNSVRWYHKSLRSDAITFETRPDHAIDIAKPFLTGFEYSRSGDRTGSTTHTPDVIEHNMYVHPEYQSVQKHYVREFDIYSLGIILVEIAHWQSIHQLLAPEFKRVTDPSRVRDILLSTQKSYLPKVRTLCGDRYYKATHGCIEGLTEQGDEEDDISFAFRQQQAFLENVVGELAELQDL